MFDSEQEPKFGGHAIFGMNRWSKSQSQIIRENHVSETSLTPIYLLLGNLSHPQEAIDSWGDIDNLRKSIRETRLLGGGDITGAMFLAR